MVENSRIKVPEGWSAIEVSGADGEPGVRFWVTARGVAPEEGVWSIPLSQAAEVGC